MAKPIDVKPRVGRLSPRTHDLVEVAHTPAYFAAAAVADTASWVHASTRRSRIGHPGLIDKVNVASTDRACRRFPARLDRHD
jgi:hypothetical protein